MTTTYLFAGGGTGGHIYPALAIAEQLLALDPTARTRILCSTRPLDAEILRAETLSAAGGWVSPVSFTPIPAAPFALSPRGLLRFIGSWGGAVRAGRAVMREARATGPVHVVAMGGFVAAPAVQAARAQKLPITLVNLDAVPGRANRWVARHAAHVFTAAKVPGSEWTLVPPIVRRAAVAPGNAEQCRRRLNLDPDRFTLLITGASQGAQSINRLMLAIIHSHREALAGWQVIHQTGKSDTDMLRAEYSAAGVPAIVEPYIREMGPAWGAADLAVSRAGAGSVAEAWANNIPTIFLPYPYHKDQHQRLNAQPLADAGACILLEDRIDATANLASAGAELLKLIADSEARARLRSGLNTLGPANGASIVADYLASLPSPAERSD